MTNPDQPPIVPGPGTYTPTPAYPVDGGTAPKRRSPLPWIIGGLAVLLLLCGGFLAIGALASTEDKASPDSTTARTAPAVKAPAAAATTAAAPAPAVTPKTSDFQLTAKITKKECFGSAGCNIEFWVKMAYREDAPDLDPDDTWIVTYEVNGVEDGPQINTIEVTGDQYSHDETELAQTSSSSKKLTIKVTDVEKKGL